MELPRSTRVGERERERERERAAPSWVVGGSPWAGLPLRFLMRGCLGLGLGLGL